MLLVQQKIRPQYKLKFNCRQTFTVKKKRNHHDGIPIKEKSYWR